MGSPQKYPKRNSFTSKHEFAFAEHLVHMHRSGEILSHNIGSHVVLEVINMLLQRFGISFPSNSIRSKYYALQGLTRLYISFKKRGTGMGGDSTNYTFMMDDERWSHLVQVYLLAGIYFIAIQNYCIVSPLDFLFTCWFLTLLPFSKLPFCPPPVFSL